MLVGRMNPSVLYVSYDGVLEVALLTFEKPEDLADEARRLAMWRRLSNLNIAWVPLNWYSSAEIGTLV